jgi:hypothetical protein
MTETDQKTHELEKTDVVKHRYEGQRGEVVEVEPEQVRVQFHDTDRWLDPSALEPVAPWDYPGHCGNCGAEMSGSYGKGGDVQRELRAFTCPECRRGMTTWIRVNSELYDEREEAVQRPNKVSPQNVTRTAKILDGRFPKDRWHKVERTDDWTAVVTVAGGDERHAQIIRDAFEQRDMTAEVVQNDASVLKVEVEDPEHWR